MALQIGDGDEWFDSLADVETIDDLGAVRRGRGRAMPGPRRGRAALPAAPYAAQAPAPYAAPFTPAQYYGQAVPAARLIPTIPGAPAIGVRLQPLGFPLTAFTASSGTALPVTSRPQRPFKAKRLVIAYTRTGTSATGLVTVTELSIGTNNQFVSRQPIGADTFAANSVDVNMELAAATTSLDITVGYAISVAPTMTDRVDIATTIMGESVGG